MGLYKKWMPCTVTPTLNPKQKQIYSRPSVVVVSGVAGLVWSPDWDRILVIGFFLKKERKKKQRGPILLSRTLSANK